MALPMSIMKNALQQTFHSFSSVPIVSRVGISSACAVTAAILRPSRSQQPHHSNLQRLFSTQRPALRPTTATLSSQLHSKSARSPRKLEKNLQCHWAPYHDKLFETPNPSPKNTTRQPRSQPHNKYKTSIVLGGIVTAMIVVLLYSECSYNKQYQTSNLLSRPDEVATHKAPAKGTRVAILDSRSELKKAGHHCIIPAQPFAWAYMADFPQFWVVIWEWEKNRRVG